MLPGNALASRNSDLHIVQVNPPHLPVCSENPFADCVWAAVETEPINQSNAKIIITISMGTAEVAPRLFGGRVRIGLNRAKLRLRVGGGEIPQENRWPQNDIETLINVEETEERVRRSGTSSKSSVKAKVTSSDATGEIINEGNDHADQQETVRRSFRVGEWVVHSGGSEKSPYWEFRAIKPKGEVYLSFAKREVARLFITDTRSEASINYGIEFLDSDIRILGSEGMFTGRAGSDDLRKWGIILTIVRLALAADLRTAVDLRR